MSHFLITLRRQKMKLHVLRKQIDGQKEGIKKRIKQKPMLDNFDEANLD